MAINVQKLLPAAKTSSIAKIGAKTVSSSLAINKKTIDAKKLTALSIRRSEENVSIIKKSLIDIDSLLKSVLTEDQKTERTKRIRKEQDEREQRETKLETPKESKKFNLPKVSLPRMSFLDRIKRFLFFTALGWLFTKFQDQLPKLTGIIKIITPIAGVVENVFKFILESVVNFIDRGYQTYDKIRGLVKTVGGEKAQGEFDNISGKLNEYINYVLIGGMALTGAINTFANNARKYKPPKPTPQGTPRGPVPQRGPIQRVVRPVQAASIRASRAVIGKQATRQLLRLVRLAKGPLSRLPIVGALVEFGLSWALGDNPGKAAFRGVGTLLLGAVGSLIMPGFGTFAGSWAGAELAGKLYDVLFANKSPEASVQTQRRGGKVIRRYAKGGEVLGSGGRTLTVSKKKKPYIPPKLSQPGKDVGGKKSILKLFPDPSKKLSVTEWNMMGYAGTYADYEKEYEKQKNKPNPYRALTEVSAILKGIPYGIGSLMGAAVDVALGQKLDNNTFKSITFGLENLFEAFKIISNKTSQGVFAIQNQIPTMAYGGQVSRTFTPASNSNIDLMNIFGNSIKQRVNESIREIQKQISIGKGEYTPEEFAKTDGGGRYTPPSQQERFPEAPTGKNGRYKASELMNVGPLSIPPDYKDWYGNNAYLRRSDAGPAFMKAKAAAAKEKISFVINSAYRSYEHQDFMVKSGKYKVIAAAGKSSHGDGTAVDIEVGTAGWKWLVKNGRDYGWKWMQYEEDEVHFAYVGGGKFEKTQQTPTQKPTTTPVKPPSNEVKTAEASWYGPGFYGNETSSRKELKRNSMWVAHRTLPFGTKVKFTYKGRTITLPVEDRGPFYGNREWDFTEAAAEAIGLKADGTGTVEYQIIELGKRASLSDQINKVASLKSFGVDSILPIGGSFDEPMDASKVFSLPKAKQDGEQTPFLTDDYLVTPPEYRGGGYIPKQKPKNKSVSLTSYPSYADGSTQIMIQPIIIRETVPIPVSRSSGGATTFMVAGGVNSSNMQSLVRG